MTTEDEFAKRDATGLKPTFAKGAKTASQAEAETRGGYIKMIALSYLGAAPLLALGLLWLAGKVSPALSEQYSDRVALLRAHDLGWIYAAWYLLSLARTYATINANGCRAAGRVERPDQHAYKIMANPQTKEGKGYSDAPYVLMENVGPVGRFNRAQRAAFHFDEGLELLLGSIFLAGVIVPRLVFGLTAVLCAGRKMFTDGYTESLQGRMSPFALVALPSMVLGAMVGVFAAQSLLM